ncbi:hypothetical protein FIU94_08050 [Sulfitobacter sp. THAF37]|uniref:hypothetical protein n=1 Tax=Sulfitobacter sp. THAF37 TaxID=2587855 RepID=UPI0012688633|nr:hypothetical protein [Sulfitobacter sp. THAF37]QFT58775.1 hypothetical protein FIU94_08050 [Sulfitobacter sp. THAF37]
MPVLVLVLFMAFISGPAQAGAWMREKGTSFVSSTFVLNRLLDQSSSTYVEHGWSDDLTIGADISLANSHLGLQSGAATFFFRRRLGPAESTQKWAYEIGAGTAWVQDLMLPHVKLGLSWGRNFEAAGRWGWMGVDGALFWDVSTGRRAAKLDGTVGYNFSDVTAGMIQIYLAQIDGQSHATFAPSILIRPRNRNFRIQIGTESPFDAFSATSVKLGIWREF